MTFSIVPPTAPPTIAGRNSPGSDASDDEDGDVDIARQRKSGKQRSGRAIITPGEVVTEDPQWMR